MGWEKRQRGGMYYYKPVRLGGRPRRIYCGRGNLGRIHELLDRRLERARRAAAEARRHLEARLAEADRLWSAVWVKIRALTSAHLLTVGWYCHRGTWRKVMTKPRTRQKKTRPATPEEAADLQGRLIALNERANAGDASALAELKVFLDEHPEVWRAVGDVNRMSVSCWVSLIAGKDALHRESINRFVADWKDRLVGPGASPTEKGLVDTAVVARLALTHAECVAAADGDPLKVAGFKVKRLDAALHRLNATLKLLAQVRAACPGGAAPVSPPAAGVPRLYVPPVRRKKAG